MENREELLRLISYSNKVTTAAAWLDDRVRAFANKEIGMSDEAHPEEGLKEAFEAIDNDLAGVSTILEDMGIKKTIRTVIIE